MGMTIAEIILAKKSGQSKVGPGDIIVGAKTLPAIGLPPKLLDLLKAGGIYPLLEQEGLIAPRT